MKNKVSGFGLVEYLLGVIVLVGILFVPVKNGKSLSVQLIDAVKKEHSAYIFVASIPNMPKVSFKANKLAKKSALAHSVNKNKLINARRNFTAHE